MRSFRSLSLLLALTLLLPLAGCGALRSLKPVKNGELQLGVVLQAQSAQVLYARDKLAFYLQNELGVALSEDAEGFPYRLLLGNTGEEKSKALAAELGEEEYLVRVMGKDIVIVAGNEAFLYDAVEALLQSDKLQLDRARGTLRLSGNLTLRGTGNKSSIRYLFTQGGTLASTSAPYTTLHSPEGQPTEQGGCFDGTYYYQAFLKKHSASNEEQNEVRIGKFDYKTKELIAYSEVMALNHCNDITYNSKTGELFVAHNNPHRTRVSVLSADTMQLLRTVEIEARIYGISYNAARDRFAVALSDSQNMRILDGGLSPVDNKEILGTELTKNYTTQGICSDDTFIYHVLWDGARRSKPTFQNAITVYDWYGNFVGIIHIGIGIIEPENVSIDENGKLMVVASTKNGGALYEITVTGAKAA